MMLQALYELAQAEQLIGDPDFEFKPVAWVVDVGKEGRFCGIRDRRVEEDTGGKKKKKPRLIAPKAEIPRQVIRTSGAASNFLVDKAEYALGIDLDGKRKPEQLAQRFELFRRPVSRCAQDTADEGILAVAALLEAIASGSVEIELDETASSNDLFTFQYIDNPDSFVHQRKAVRHWWKASRAVTPGTTARRCLVTGSPVSGEIPLFPSIKRVPGGSTSGVGLVSFNARAFESYGLEGNENAPVSREAAEACSTALNRLLDPAPVSPANVNEALPKRHLRLTADTAVCYWAPKSKEPLVDEVGDLIEANAENVGTMYHAIWKGKPPHLKDPSAFYAVTLTGTQGRAIVRDWFETTVAQAFDRLAQYFADIRLVRNCPPPKTGHAPQFPMGLLTESMGLRGDRGQVPAHLAAGIVRAALSEALFPMAVLQRALERYRAEIGRDEWSDLNRRDARAALIKAALNRRMRRGIGNLTKEIQPAMDLTNTEPGYRLGRVMAVVERMQLEALGDVNATVVDRYFGGASASPASVVPRLLKGFHAHLRKVRDDESKARTGHWLKNELDGILECVTAFPRFLDLEQQGLFVLGYHHERHWLWMKKEDRNQAIEAAQQTANTNTTNTNGQ